MDWNDSFNILQSYKPSLEVTIIIWLPPQPGWLKCNTDRESKGNREKSSYGFSIGDYNGDLIYAEANDLGETKNTIAEATIIKKALLCCVT